MSCSQRTRNGEFEISVVQALDDAGAFAMVSRGPVVLFERLACAAGAADWFYCETIGDLAVVSTRFHPASRVLVYSSKRVIKSTVATWSAASFERALAVGGGAYVGSLGADGHAIAMTVISSALELPEASNHLRQTPSCFTASFRQRVWMIRSSSRSRTAMASCVRIRTYEARSE